MSEERPEDREDLITAEEAIEDAQEELEEDALLEEEESQAEEEIDESQEDEPEEIQTAKKYGHLSKEEWVAQGKDPNQWKSPEEFNKTGKILEQIYALRDQVNKRDREIEALVEYQKRTSQREYERAKQDLEARLAASKEDMDMEAVSHYTKELTRLEDNERQEEVSQFQTKQREAQQRFLERNSHWFNDRNPDLVRRAQEIDNELKVKNYDVNDIADIIEFKIQREFPDRILGPKTQSRPSVSPSQSSVNKTAVNKSSVKKTFQGLSQELKDAYSATKRIVESRGDKEYTVNDFIEQLKRDGEI